MKTCRFLVVLAMLVCCATPIRAQEHVTLASLDWPPYTGFYLPGNGLASTVVQQAFDESGIDVSIAFFPWRRAVSLAQKAESYIGFFPEYPTLIHGEEFLFSKPIGTSVLRLVESVDSPVHWETLKDLAPYTIGVVAGYVNTGEFDSMVEEGRISVDSTGSDIQNIRKVASGRIHAAIIDELVFDYLMKTEVELVAYRASVRLSDKPLGSQTLHVCFRNSTYGRYVMRLFDEALEQLDIEKIQKEYLDALK